MIESSSWHSYPKIFALGHKAIEELFYDPVIVEEKIDGSQFSFGKFGGEILARSKKVIFPVDAPVDMFGQACRSVLDIADKLHPEWTYRAEYLTKPHHNGLAYDRVPARNLIIFDINTGEESYLSYQEKVDEAYRLGLECVPLLHAGDLKAPEELLHLLELHSILGGPTIEGVVVKNYHRFGMDKKVLMGKYVSEAYKETQKIHWKSANPTNGDVIQAIITAYRQPARWMKAVQHLREEGKLEDSPRDIGPLIKTIPEDVREECEEEMRDKLMAYAWPQIKRGLTAGFPEWYKQLLLEKQFERKE